MTVEELSTVIVKMTDDERMILSDCANAIVARRKARKVHTKAELLGRVERSNKKLASGDTLKNADVFLAEIRRKYGIRA